MSNLYTRRPLVLNSGRVFAGVEKVTDADILSAFNEFKQSHQQQLDEIKAGINDNLLDTKINQLSSDILAMQKRFDEQVLEAAAAQTFGGQKLADADYTSAFEANFRKGDYSAAMERGNDGNGGYLAPVEWDRTIGTQLLIASPFRSLAKIQTISGAGFSKLFAERAISGGWVGEKDPRPTTNTGLFKKMEYGTHELYANPIATQQLLDDAEINVQQWLADDVLDTFATFESQAFMSGDGVNMPFGLLTYIEGGTNANKHPYGAITTVSSGDANKITSDAIVDLIHSLPSQLATGARFAMNRNTLATLLKLKDGNGNYLWQPSFAAGTPATIAGYAYTEMGDLPNVAANSTPILFGDFKRTYLIIDRKGVSVLRDPYSSKPYVQFYTTRRVGGGLLSPEPMRALKIG